KTGGCRFESCLPCWLRELDCTERSGFHGPSSSRVLSAQERLKSARHWRMAIGQPHTRRSRLPPARRTSSRGSVQGGVFAGKPLTGLADFGRLRTRRPLRGGRDWFWACFYG